jgi:peptidoglycan/LPS O-acetylase OafA/YrhL
MQSTDNNKANAPLLTRAECAALRGIAIIGIFLHNYCHWLGFAVKENEYTFRMTNCRDLLRAVSAPDANLAVHLLSFFGHYGVPVFLFLSAYGLVMKYENSPSSPVGAPEKASSFIVSHYKKLFSMMIVGFVAFTMVDAITPGAHHYKFIDVVGQLLMFNNLMPDPDHVIWPGPYWFFGLMLQLYVVYRLVLHRRSSWLTVLLIALCWLLQAVCAPDGDALNRVRYNFMGGMLPFGAGLLFARHGRDLTRPQWCTVAVLSAVAVCLFSFNYQLWLWAPLMVCTFSVALAKLMPRRLTKAMAWVGGISAALFVLHPITRKIFIPVSRHGDVYTGLLLYVVASVAIAYFYHFLRGQFRKSGKPHKSVRRPIKR